MYKFVFNKFGDGRYKTGKCFFLFCYRSHLVPFKFMYKYSSLNFLCIGYLFRNMVLKIYATFNNKNLMNFLPLVP